MSADGDKNLDVSEQEVLRAIAKVFPSLVEQVLRLVVKDATARAIRAVTGRVD